MNTRSNLTANFGLDMRVRPSLGNRFSQSVSVVRVGGRVGVVPNESLVKLDEALRLHLAL